MIRYAITHVASDGNRVLTRGNQGRNHFDTREEAEGFMLALADPASGLRAVIGDAAIATLRVRAVECHAHGDSKATVFDPDAPEPVPEVLGSR